MKPQRPDPRRHALSYQTRTKPCTIEYPTNSRRHGDGKQSMEKENQDEQVKSTDNRLDLHALSFLLGQLGQLLKDLAKVLAIGTLVELLVLGRLGGHHDHTGWALGGGRGTEFGTGSDENVGDAVVLAQNGNVRDDVHGRDIGSENDDSRGNVDLDIGGGDWRLAESLDDFLDTTLERLVDGSCVRKGRG